MPPSRTARSLSIPRKDDLRHFDAAEFFRSGHSWREIFSSGQERANSPRPAELAWFDMDRVLIVDGLTPRERLTSAQIDFWERARRLRSLGYTLLGASAFRVLWKHRHVIPSSWKHAERVEGPAGIASPRVICFDGTEFYRSDGSHIVLCLWYDWRKRGWDYFWRDCRWRLGDWSAVFSASD
jgi:hypothetical protein